MANKVTIDTTALNIPWELGTTYRVDIDQAFVNATTGTKLPNSAITGATSFSTFDDPPLIDELDPPNGTILDPITVAIVRTINITFDRNKIRINTGNIYLYKVASPSDVLIQTYDITTDVIVLNDNTLSIDITDLLEPDQQYYVTADANIIEDYDNFNWAGVSTTDVITFTAPSAPVIDVFYPADDSIDILENQEFSFTVNRTGLTVQTGNVNLYRVDTPDVLIKSYDITSDVAFDGIDTFTFDVTSQLGTSEDYYITIDADIVKDNDEFGTAAITSTEWNFSTSANFSRNLTKSETGFTSGYAEDTRTLLIDGPRVININDTDTFTLVITPTDPLLVASMDSEGTGGSSVWAANALTITGTKTQINSHLDALYLTPETDVIDNITLTYVCTAASDLVTSTQTMLVYNVLENTEVVNIDVTRYYYRDSAGPIFTDNTPYIDDAGVDPQAIYTVTLSSPDGQFGIPIDGVAYQDTLTITGNKDYVNSKFFKIYFLSDGMETPSTFTYTQTRGTREQVNITVDLLFGGIGFFLYKFDTPGTYTFTPTEDEAQFNTFDILLVGGGGAGDYLAGGAGGQVIEILNRTFSHTSTYNITVGAGGQALDWTDPVSGLGTTGWAPTPIACLFGDPDGAGPAGDCLRDPDATEPYDLVAQPQYLVGTGTSGGQSVDYYATNNAAQDWGFNVTRGQTTTIDQDGLSLFDQALGGGSGWGYVNANYLSISDQSYLTPELGVFGGNTPVYAAPLFRHGGIVTRYRLTESGVPNYPYGKVGQDTALQATQKCSQYVFNNWIPTGAGGAGWGGDGYGYYNVAEEDRARGGLGYRSPLLIDYEYYAGGGGGTGAVGGSGVGGNGFNWDGQNAPAQDGQTPGSGGGAGYYDQNGNVYPSGNGAPGRVVLISRPRVDQPNVSLFYSATSNTNTIQLPANLLVSDFAVLFDYSTAVTDIVPTGWTKIASNSIGTTSGMRVTASYKKLSSSDSEQIITGMSGTTRKTLLIFRPTNAINRITATVTGNVVTTGNPGPQPLYMSTESPTIMAFAHYASSNAIDPRTSTVESGSVASMTEVAGYDTRQYVKYALYNQSDVPGNIIIDMDDEGSYNGLQSFYIQIAR